MWIVGLLLGLVIGAAINGWEGAMLGALVGWALGYGFRQLIRGHDAKVQDAGLESRLASVEAALRALDIRLSVIEGRPAPEASRQSTDAAAGQLTFSQGTADPLPTPPRIDMLPSPAPDASTEQTPAELARSAPHPSARRPASVPREPSFLWRWFTGGNTLVRVGVVVLFFGIAFLLKYAYEHTRIPIELRLTGVAIAAVVLLIIGWRLRIKRPDYALALQGGGVGVLYLTIFAAFRLYQVLPPEGALVLLFLVASLSAALAVMQDAQSLAVLGASGGFLAPILASTGTGNHVMLFSYYVMLNIGIVGIAWYRAWRPLNVVGFLFTFGIGTLWGSRFYRPELFLSTEPFLVIFFVMYLAIPMLFARRRARPAASLGADQVQSYVDGTLVFGTPLVAFGLQTQLVRDIQYGSAWSALALSFVYLVLARWLWARHRDDLRLLVESFLALGVVFGTLAIPLALDGRWTSAAWALEGAAIVWAGARQNRWLARNFGLFLQIAAGFAFLVTVDRGYGDVPVLNSFYLGCVFISVAGFFSNWVLERHRDRLRKWEPALAIVIFAWGLLWWIGGGAHEIHVQVSGPYQNRVALLFAAGSCVAFSLLWKALSWRLARYPALALLLAMLLVAATDAADFRHPFAHLGLVAWPVAFAAHLWVLRRHDEADNPYIDFLHAGQLWLLAALASWELAWVIDHGIEASPVWGMIAWGVVPGLLLALLATRAQLLPWPVRGRLATYALLGAAPLAVFLWAWILVANATSDGNASPLPYVPLLNPLDLAQFAAWLAIFDWIHGLKRMDLADYAGDSPALTYFALGAIAFIGLNGSLLRALHHWAAIPYDLETMLRSTLVQAALSIFWSVLALCAMMAATRLRVRALWIVGASLMAVVVAKLILVDLSNTGTVERIVSFIGVGVLMLLIGYISPVPPRTSESPK
jgi:uncharacterized membrane protein